MSLAAAPCYTGEKDESMRNANERKDRPTNNAPKQVVGAIIIEEGKVLAAKRGACKYAYVAHKYEFAGGKQEPDETLAEALVRELREEMAMTVEVLRPYRTVEHRYPDFAITLHTFLCRRTSDYTLLEHEDAVWIPLDALDASLWAPADAPIIETLRGDMTLRTQNR